MHNELDSKNLDFNLVLNKIKKNKGKYNCIIGISGGQDSSTILYAAVKKWGLSPLVIHFNNHWNTDNATFNMKQLIQKLNVDFIEYYVNKEEFDNLNKAFLLAGTPDCDIPNDIAMTKLMYETCEKYNIKYILNGHCYKTEGSTPKAWTYMDAKYIKDVYYRFFKKELINYPLFEFKDQLHYNTLNIQQIRPFHYQNVNRFELDKEMKEFINYKSYGWKHGENSYTDFVGSYLLPKKFGIDKRIVYLSARIRTGLLTKEKARNILNCEPSFDTDILGDEYMDLIDSPIVDRNEYDSYNFKEANWMIYYLYLCGTVPYTFYIKYSQKIDEFEYHKLEEVPHYKLKKIKDTIKNTIYNDKELEEVRKKLCEKF
jgi:tRNA(Ile)-lysidine synthase TilS/MesJ